MKVISCKFCHKDFSIEKSGVYQCPYCLQRQEIALDEPALGVPVDGDTEETTVSLFLTPWENRKALGLFAALKETWVRTCTDPVNFFRMFKPGAHVGEWIVGAS